MTAIEWCDETWNPIVGCSRVSKGCENCYAERTAHRGMAPQHRGLTVLGAHGPRWTGEVRLVEDRLALPLSWRKPRRAFVNSMSDLFHEKLGGEDVARVFAVMQASPAHTFQVLTKRPARMREMLSDEAFWNEVADRCEDIAAEHGWCHAHDDREAPLSNVWLGVSVEDQATADERIPLLLDTPAAVRFVSYEPALGPVDFQFAAFNGADSLDSLEGLHWIIVGGESGSGARPFDLAWARSTIAQCRAAGVPVFFKQAGARPYEFRAWPEVGDTTPVKWSVKLRDRKGGDMAEWPEDLRVREFPRG